MLRHDIVRRYYSNSFLGFSLLNWHTNLVLIRLLKVPQSAEAPAKGPGHELLPLLPLLLLLLLRCRCRRPPGYDWAEARGGAAGGTRRGAGRGGRNGESGKRKITVT